VLAAAEPMASPPNIKHAPRHCRVLLLKGSPTRSAPEAHCGSMDDPVVALKRL
jgi:hypothetical protein